MPNTISNYDFGRQGANAFLKKGSNVIIRNLLACHIREEFSVNFSRLQRAPIYSGEKGVSRERLTWSKACGGWREAEERARGARERERERARARESEERKRASVC